MNPETFAEAISRINPDLRLRWNNVNQTWAIEQHVGRGQFETPLSYDDPSYARVRDGFALVMEIAPRPVIRCSEPECRLEFEIDALRFAEYRCPHCTRRGEKTHYFVGYFPFCDALLQHLRRLSPERQREAQRVREASKYNSDRAFERKSFNDLDASLRESHNAIVGIPSKGWTPSTGAAGWFK